MSGKVGSQLSCAKPVNFLSWPSLCADWSRIKGLEAKWNCPGPKAGTMARWKSNEVSSCERELLNWF